MTDGNDLHKATWVVEVILNYSVWTGGPRAASYEVTGPATFEIDDEKNLRVITILEDDFGTEVVVALHLGGTYSSVNQFVMEAVDPELSLEEASEADLPAVDDEPFLPDYDGPDMQPGDDLRGYDDSDPM